MGTLDRSLYGSSKFPTRSYPFGRKKPAEPPKRKRVKRYNGKGRLNPEIAALAPQISPKHYKFISDGFEREPSEQDALEIQRTIEAATAAFRAQHLAAKREADGNEALDDEESDDEE